MTGLFWWHFVVPIFSIAVWCVHAVQSWREPFSMGWSGWTAILGFPVAAAVFFIAAPVVYAATSSSASGSDPRMPFVVLSIEFAFACLAAWVLELPLFLIRNMRRQQHHQASS